jgi:CHAT domain-containing protein
MARTAIVVAAAVLLLCAPARGDDDDPRLVEAQGKLDEAEQLTQAGRFAEAIPPTRRALALLTQVGGADHLVVADVTLKLANLHFYAAEYDQAEPLYGKALAGFERHYGKDGEGLLAVLSSIANFRLTTNDLDQADATYRRALAIAKKDGEESRNVAQLMGGLAFVAMRRGKSDEAQAMYERAIAIFERAAGKDDPNLVAFLGALASLASNQKQYDKAVALERRAITLLEKSLGPHHPRTALAVNNLASTLVWQGDFTAAEALARRAVADTEAVFGVHHPQVASLNVTLAYSLLAQGRIKDSLPLWARMLDSGERLLRAAALHATEYRVSAFLEMWRHQELSLYSLAHLAPEDPAVLRLALGVLLLRKGRAMDEAADLARVVLAGLPAADRAAFDRLKATRQKIAALVLGGAGEKGKQAQAQAIDALEAEARTLEQALADRSAPLRTRAGLPGALEIVDRVAAALPPDGALVEVVSYRPIDFKKGGADYLSEERYQAFVLRPGGKVRRVDLGLREELDREVTALLKAAARPAPAPDLAAAEALDRRLWQPLLAALDGVKQVRFSPDGELHLAPLYALWDGKQFLVDRVELAVLASGRDLLRERAAPGREVVVLADPDFGKPARGKTRAASPLLPRDIPRLPGTRKEAAALKAIVARARVVSDKQATEAELLALSHPLVLHVATHGVFLGEAGAGPGGARGLVVKSGEAAAPAPASAPKDPLLRSALILAGAAGKPGAGDGLATALELLGMDLWGTQLVVLSACETGRGEVRAGEGVYGLRRALIIAGAESVVSSLWRVDDAVTRELMERFYRALHAGADRAQALAAAARDVRAHHPHPYYWAPFLLVGRTGPLSDL